MSLTRSLQVFIIVGIIVFVFVIIIITTEVVFIIAVIAIVGVNFFDPVFILPLPRLNVYINEVVAVIREIIAIVHSTDVVVVNITALITVVAVDITFVSFLLHLISLSVFQPGCTGFPANQFGDHIFRLTSQNSDVFFNGEECVSRETRSSSRNSRSLRCAMS